MEKGRGVMEEGRGRKQEGEEWRERGRGGEVGGWEGFRVRSSSGTGVREPGEGEGGAGDRDGVDRQPNRNK